MGVGRADFVRSNDFGTIHLHGFVWYIDVCPIARCPIAVCPIAVCPIAVRSICVSVLRCLGFFAGLAIELVGDED